MYVKNVEENLNLRLGRLNSISQRIERYLKGAKTAGIRIKLPAIILAAQTKVTVTILVMQILQVLVLM